MQNNNEHKNHKLKQYIDGNLSEDELNELFELDELYGQSEISASCVVCHK